MSASQLRVAGAAVPIPTQADADPSVGLPPGQEAELRACALAIEADGQRLCVITCDTLVIPSDVLDAAVAEIVARTGLPFTHVLVCATHTHHGAATLDILGARRDPQFCAGLQDALIRAAVDACAALDDARPGAELLFAQSQEATVGVNSRYLLRDGTIAWYNYPWEDVVRPTGPCDPDLPVLALRGPGGLIGILFSHSSHNIGSLTEGARSPGFYGLAAQELERRYGAVTLFLPGAFGSTHNTGGFGSNEHIHAISGAECVHRVVEAVEEGLGFAEPIPAAPLRVLKREFIYRKRRFDEAAEEAAVRYWSETYAPGDPEGTQRVFREMREQMAPVQGEERQAWLQVMRLGEVALACVPAELFARLGLEIRRRSPFRHTCVIGLANGTIGYVGDRAAYELGGYQLWAGMHSPSAPGSGEAMVEQALAMLREVHED